jgi:hypothetical protein
MSLLYKKLLNSILKYQKFCWKYRSLKFSFRVVGKKQKKQTRSVERGSFLNFRRRGASIYAYIRNSGLKWLY